jgi:hypothetical protein
LTDALGNLVRFNLLPGHRYDTIGVAPLVEGVKFEGLIAEQGIRRQLDHRGDERTRRKDRHLATAKAQTATSD